MKTRLMLALFALTTTLIAQAGNRAGNGFAVECRDDRENNLKAGYYSLDYLATVGLGAPAKVKSWKESAERIRKRLRGVITDAQLALFDDFVANVRNEKDYTKNRVWESAPFGVVNLKLEPSPETPGKEPLHKEQLKSNLQSLVQKLPDSCLNAKGEVDLIPAVVFQDHFFTGRPVGTLVYKFVPKVLNTLEENDPLQLSFLYIHEWLWDISNNEDRNRRLNQLLHSERADAIGTAELRKQLKGMGVEMEPGAPDEPDLDSGDLKKSFESTAIPKRELKLATIQKALLQQGVAELGPYEVHSLSRTCRTPTDCTPWKATRAVWKDLGNIGTDTLFNAVRGGSLEFGRQHDVPYHGSVTLRREANWTLLVNSDPVAVDGGARRVIQTECKIDHDEKGSDHGRCRKMWGPDADFNPIGHLWVGNTSPDLTVVFTPTHLWIGGHASKGVEESRFAIIAPYPKGITIQEPKQAAFGLPPSPGDPSAEGFDTRVIEVPLAGLSGGKLTGDKTFSHDVEVDLAGTLSAIRGYVVYEPGLESAGVWIQRYADGVLASGKSGVMTDLNPHDDFVPTKCNLPGFPKGSCASELRPGFAVKSAGGTYRVTFDLRPFANKTPRIHSLRILFQAKTELSNS